MLILSTILLAIFITVFFAFDYWYRTYNKLQRFLTKAQNNYANIPVIMQKRLDNIYTLSQIADRYHIHEHETMRDTIQARSITHAGLHAVLEKYPDLKANEVFMSLMNRDSQIEGQLNQARMGYNKSVEDFNATLRQFPQNIIANYYHFKELDYLDIEPKLYKSKDIFSN